MFTRPYALFVVVLSVGMLVGLSAGPDSGLSRERDLVALQEVFEKLGSTPTGAQLLKVAQKKWKLKAVSELTAVVDWGETSRTDAILTRHYDPSTGEEVREKTVVIYLRQDQAIGASVLDLAHELTHGTTEQTWDPYDPKLTAEGYIRAGIEGAGGEVEAVWNECRVSAELEQAGGEAIPGDRCGRYIVGKTVDRGMILKDFYKVGESLSGFLKELNVSGRSPASSPFPELSDETPTLISSTWNQPYPLALFREYEELTRLACANTTRRLSALKRSSPLTSKPGSSLQSKMDEMVRTRCTQ